MWSKSLKLKYLWALRCEHKLGPQESSMFSKHEIFPVLSIIVSIVGIIYFSVKLKKQIASLRTKNQHPLKGIALNFIKYIGAMVVFSLAMLFAGIVLSVHMFGNRESGQEKDIAKIQMGQIYNSLSMYYSDCGKYPSSLDNLVTPDPSCPNWGSEPYEIEKYITDPWGRRYIYNKGTDSIEIRSYGEDGVPGGTKKSEDIFYKIDL